MLENEIRILDILPCGSDNPQDLLKCEVRVVSLSDKPVYDALSYRWGDPESRRCILVDDREVYVTENLHAALIRLRQEDEKKTIWIDQLCIDQQNQEEKAVQVRLMREVYSNCQQCLIWMDEINENIRQSDAEAVLDVLSWLVDRSLPIPPCTASASAFEGPIHALSSIGIGVHQWWDRVWTVQEAILPSNKVFLWGPFRMSWEKLTKGSHVWTRTGLPAELFDLMWKPNSPDLSAIMQRTLGWLFCNVIWINSAHSQYEEPVQTIIKWVGRKATDPKDKVFGLLGLLPPLMERRFTDKCDYGTSVAQIYTAFTLDVILFHGDLLPLVLQQRAPWSQGTNGLPSWACDMGDYEMSQWNHHIDRWYLRWGYQYYDACAGRKLDKASFISELHASMSGSSSEVKTLSLTGIAVDTIAITAPGLTRVAAKSSATVAETLRSWMDEGRKYHATIDGGLIEEEFTRAFWRLVVSDGIRDGEQRVNRRPNEKDFADISEFIRTGRGLINGLDFWYRYVELQTFFITKNGIMGLGHWETKIGDEVWVFYGGNMPFTIRKNGDARQDEFDFVGSCYADSIMDGEIYRGAAGRSAEEKRRTIRLH
ncbi:heterokaryon incompatibility protein-domain-containing protein [Cadophora sp. MPI-SDFR-AT-0126]|nr:heterokaryon incompatibility protein-domain-containing protein [Leotiomycetes sp. MPI-SDFR-AT-0126]